MRHIEAIIAVNLPILIGYLSRLIKLIPDSDTAALRRFVIQVSVPFIIFANLYKSDISSANQLIPAASALFIISVLFILFSLAVTLKFFKNPVDRNTYVTATMFGNYGYLGWGVMQGFYGPQGLNRAVFFTVFSWPIFLLLGFTAIRYLKGNDDSEGNSISFFLKVLLKNALLPVSAVASALLMNYFHVGIHKVIWVTIEKFAGITIPLILFTVGMSFHLKVERDKLAVTIAGAFSRIIPGMLFGIVTVLILTRIFNIDPITRKVILMEAIMPTATVAVFFAEFLETDDKLLSGILTFSTLLSLVTIPLWYITVEKLAL